MIIYTLRRLEFNLGEGVVDTRLNEESEAILSTIRANRNIITKVDKAAHVVELEKAKENLRVAMNNIKAGG